MPFLELENASRRASLEPTFATRPTRNATCQFWPLIFSMNSIDFWKSKTDLNFCALSCASRHNKNYGLAHNALGYSHLRSQNHWYFNNSMFYIIAMYTFYNKNQYETHNFQNMSMLDWPRGTQKSALAIRDMKTQWILTILCCRVRGRVVFHSVFASLRGARGAIVGRFVLQMTACVTFGAPLIDVHFRAISKP